MKIVLYDRDPASHHVLDISGLETMGLCWVKPDTPLPELEGFSAVAAHASDDLLYKQGITEEAIKRSIPLVLYSGAYSVASELEASLRQRFPKADISCLMVEDLAINLTGALRDNNLEQLFWNRLADVFDLLSTLWALGIAWEAKGDPGLFRIADSANSISDDQARISLLNLENRFEPEKLNDVETTSGRLLGELARRIYGRETRPDGNLEVLKVSNASEYYKALESLRDSLLTWAHRREA